MTRWPTGCGFGVVIMVAVVVAAAGLDYGIWQNGPHWAWKRADLHRNALHLGAVDDVEDGEVVTSTTTRRSCCTRDRSSASSVSPRST
ncbi:hypothetical protein NSA53_11020 [Cellulosimicrobium cellulans]|uniref:hypothetical protein n=1 Tax=Cellulosimicrobium cellulans TaxID=1710 RepID=UPI00214A84BE|nr:hypothetical protein [Cellulosimicrobium cellulans]